MKIGYIAFLVLALASPARAAENETPSSPVKTFDDKVIIRLFTQIPILTLSISPETKSGETASERSARNDAALSYLADMRADAGAGIYYKWFGIDYSRKVVSFSDSSSSGKSSYTDMRGYVFKRKISAEFAFLDYKGFRLTDASSHGLSSREARRSDMSYRHLSADLCWIFSDDFSHAAAFRQTEQQETWDWSMLAMLSAVSYSVNSSRSIVPPDDAAMYGSYADIRGGRFSGIAAGPGIAVTVPFGSWFLTSTFFCGAGYMHKDYRGTERDRSRHDAIFRINEKASAGYNTDGWFAGVAAYYDVTGNFAGMLVISNAFVYELYAGVRL